MPNIKSTVVKVCFILAVGSLLYVKITYKELYESFRFNQNIDKQRYDRNVYRNDLPVQCHTRSWRDLIVPCINDMSWKNKSIGARTKTNLDFSDIFIKSHPPGRENDVIIHSRNHLKQRKYYGGDYFWVNIIGSASTYVDITDNLNGTYIGKFELIEAGKYILDISLEYTLCDGLRDPPKWWFKKGNLSFVLCLVIIRQLFFRFFILKLLNRHQI